MSFIEVVVAIGITSVIVAAVVSFLHHSQSLSQRAIHNQETFSQKIQSLTWLMRDLRSASRTSLGSLLLNGGFELTDDGSLPKYWDTAISGTGQFNYVKGVSTPTIRVGFKAIALKSSSGSQVTYDSNHTMTLSSGAAFMVTGWVRNEDASNDAALALIDNSDNVILSLQSSSTNWYQLQFRYPSTGTYVGGTVTQDQVKFRISVENGTEWAYFDAVSCTPIHSVLASTTSSEVNVENQISSYSDPAESAGFRFSRWENGNLTLFRYRVEQDDGVSILVRERFNQAVDLWENEGPESFARNLQKLLFTYDGNHQIPPAGKESSILLSFMIRDEYAEKMGMKTDVDSIEVYPLSP